MPRKRITIASGVRPDQRCEHCGKSADLVLRRDDGEVFIACLNCMHDAENLPTLPTVNAQ